MGLHGFTLYPPKIIKFLPIKNHYISFSDLVVPPSKLLELNRAEVLVVRPEEIKEVPSKGFGAAPWFRWRRVTTDLRVAPSLAFHDSFGVHKG